METRHFLQVVQSYSPKNKLATQIQEALQPLDRTIFPNEKAAKQKINSRFMEACKEYLKSGGKALLPDYKEYFTNDGFGVQITDCIILHGQCVVEEIL